MDVRSEPDTPRRELATPYRWFRISPRRIQAWREVTEMLDRELMRDSSSVLATVRPLSSSEVKRLGLVRRTEVLRNG